ncbi:MAG: PAS domain S-box protein [Pyrinomonadaceae bacterium]
MMNSSLGKILIVDDEVELKNILVESLTAQGYEADGFTAGDSALEALRIQAFDVLLTDLMMPGIDGLSLLQEAMQIDPNLICIMMTGQGTIQTAVDAMKVGAFDYVLKPFRLQTMLPVLTRAMNTRHLRLENVQLREAVAIHELSETIAFTLDPQTVLSKLADGALVQSAADEVSILLPTSDGKELYVAAVRGNTRERLLGERVPLQESISSWVARERTPLILNGEVSDERFVALWPRADIRSAVSVPMQVANKLVGIINLNMTKRLRPFTLGQMKALTILAGTAAAALESASLYTKVQKAEENYRSIFENAVEGIFQSTLDGRFITANPAMARILGYESPDELIAMVTDIARQVYVDGEVRARASRLQKELAPLEAFEFEAYRKSGDKIWLSLNRRSVRDEQGVELYHEGTIEDITERKQADERVRQSERSLAEAQHLAHIGSWNWDLRDNVLSWSDEHYRILGLDPENFDPSYDSVVSSYVVPEDRELVAAQVAAILKTHEPFSFDFRVRRPDGEVRTVHARGYVLTDERNQPFRMFGTAQDITERVKAEEEQARLHAQIERERERVNNMVASVPGVVWEAWGQPNAATQRIDFVSGYVERLLGYTVEEWLSTPNFWLSLVHPDDREEAARAAAETFVTGDSGTQEFRWVAKDGRAVWVESNSVVMKDGDGQPVGMRGVTTDISERKRTEAALRESEERYRELVENARDIIYEHNLEGNYTSTNKAGQELTGYSLAETLQLNLIDTVAPEYLDKAREMLRLKLAGETVTAYELEILTKEGSRVPVEVNTRLVYQNGFPVGVQGIARDITERKRLEEALRESEEQLRQSQKLEAIGQLAGGVAHDFNNLLTAINGYSALALRRLGDDHPISSYLEEIKKAGDRAANLTRQLLAFGRKQLLQPLALNLNDIVGDMIKLLKRLIGEDIQLITKPGANLKQIKADPGQLEQVLVNLVVNARDAMPRGGIVTIETANTTLDRAYASKHLDAAPGEYVMLAISDTGTGMDQKTMSRIFEPFFTTKEKDKGTGLGLSTVYGIIRQSGGSVWVYSELGKGTTFKVYLPLVEEKQELAAETITATTVKRGSETVLLVEDEDMVRKLTSELLVESGYTVLEANGGDAAIDLGKEHKARIDLLITDVVMPKFSGKEVAERLRAIHPETRVLFMSGYTDQAIVHHGIVDSDIAFIQKPFSERALAQKIRDVLDSANGHL